MLNRVGLVLRENALLFLSAFAVALALLLPGGISSAADPTDAAGVISAIGSVFTALPVLTIALMALAIIGAALFMARRGKTAVR